MCVLVPLHQILPYLCDRLNNIDNILNMMEKYTINTHCLSCSDRISIMDNILNMMEKYTINTHCLSYSDRISIMDNILNMMEKYTIKSCSGCCPWC